MQAIRLVQRPNRVATWLSSQLGRSSFFPSSTKLFGKSTFFFLVNLHHVEDMDFVEPFARGGIIEMLQLWLKLYSMDEYLWSKFYTTCWYKKPYLRTNCESSSPGNESKEALMRPRVQYIYIYIYIYNVSCCIINK